MESTKNFVEEQYKEVKQAIEEVLMEKPKAYQFKKLEAPHLFLVLNLVKKIGVENVKKIISGEMISTAITASKGETLKEDQYAMIGMIAFDIAGLVIERLAECEHEIYALLEGTSNLSRQEIMHLDIVTFTEMIVDFIKKEELVGFLQAVLKFFK